MTTSNKETKGKRHFKAIFSHYVAIKHKPHYVFTTEQALLVKCNDYPDMIGVIKGNPAASSGVF